MWLASQIDYAMLTQIIQQIKEQSPFRDEELAFITAKESPWYSFTFPGDQILEVPIWSYVLVYGNSQQKDQLSEIIPAWHNKIFRIVRDQHNEVHTIFSLAACYFKKKIHPLLKIQHRPHSDAVATLAEEMVVAIYKEKLLGSSRTFERNAQYLSHIEMIQADLIAYYDPIIFKYAMTAWRTNIKDYGAAYCTQRIRQFFIELVAQHEFFNQNLLSMSHLEALQECAFWYQHQQYELPLFAVFLLTGTQEQRQQLAEYGFLNLDFNAYYITHSRLHQHRIIASPFKQKDYIEYGFLMETFVHHTIITYLLDYDEEPQILSALLSLKTPQNNAIVNVDQRFIQITQQKENTRVEHSLLSYLLELIKDETRRNKHPYFRRLVEEILLNTNPNYGRFTHNPNVCCYASYENDLRYELNFAAYLFLKRHIEDLNNYLYLFQNAEYQYNNLSPVGDAAQNAIFNNFIHTRYVNNGRTSFTPHWATALLQQTTLSYYLPAELQILCSEYFVRIRQPIGTRALPDLNVENRIALHKHHFALISIQTWRYQLATDQPKYLFWIWLSPKERAVLRNYITDVYLMADRKMHNADPFSLEFSALIADTHHANAPIVRNLTSPLKELIDEIIAASAHLIQPSCINFPQNIHTLAKEMFDTWHRRHGELTRQIVLSSKREQDGMLKPKIKKERTDMIIYFLFNTQLKKTTTILPAWKSFLTGKSYIPLCWQTLEQFFASFPVERQ